MFAKIGMCVRFRGDHHLIPPFIVYHRLIGVDHFWIYSNEPFKISDLPTRSYATYVPHRFVYAEHANKTRVTNTNGKVTNWNLLFDGDNFWQQDVQHQCLYRSDRGYTALNLESPSSVPAKTPTYALVPRLCRSHQRIV